MKPKLCIGTGDQFGLDLGKRLQALLQLICHHFRLLARLRFNCGSLCQLQIQALVTPLG